MAVRVDILPLDASDEKDLRRLKVCPDCPRPHLVSTASMKFPPRQIIREGDTMVIDLLERPKTAEKIVDVVKFSADTVEQKDLDELRGRVREAAAHVRRGDELAARGSLEEAAAAYAKAAALRPDASVHLALGRCHQRLGRPELARLEFERAVRSNGEDPDALFALAVVHHRAGNVGKALGEYQKALKRRANWALARRNLGTAYLDRGQIAEAVVEYRQAHRTDAGVFESKDASVVASQNAGQQYSVFARVYSTEGDLNAALSALRKAAEAGFDVASLRDDADFTPLRQDPRFVGLVARGARS
jgi:tetratricopeptide (TPR) repeat protein